MHAIVQLPAAGGLAAPKIMQVSIIPSLGLVLHACQHRNATAQLMMTQKSGTSGVKPARLNNTVGAIQERGCTQRLAAAVAWAPWRVLPACPAVLRSCASEHPHVKPPNVSAGYTSA